MTLEQHRRGPADPVPPLLRRLAGLDAAAPFQRVREHVVQGLVEDAGTAVAAALAGLREGARVGLGVGPVHLEPATDPQGRSGLRAGGPGVDHARRAAGAARAGGRVPVCVAAEDAAAAARAEAVLRLLGRLVVERSAAEWRVVDLLVPGARGQQKVVAAELGITPQAVSKAVARSLWQEEQDARPAAARLLELCLAGDGPGGTAQGSTRNPSATIHS